MPTSPTTGEVAREVHPDARVAYIDSDPVVVSHLGALLAHGNPGVTVVDGDVRDVPGVLARVSEGIDLSQPACLIMAMLLHFFDVPAAQDLVASYVAALAPGAMSSSRWAWSPARRGTRSSARTWPMARPSCTSMTRPTSRRSSDPWSWWSPESATAGPSGRAGPGAGPTRARLHDYRRHRPRHRLALTARQASSNSSRRPDLWQLILMMLRLVAPVPSGNSGRPSSPPGSRRLFSCRK